MSGASPDLGVWAAAFARSSSFAALAPLAGAGAVPKALRVTLALALTPAVAMHTPIGAVGSATSAFIENALVGAAFALAAATVAASAAAAGSLIDAALASSVIGHEAVFGGSGGPFARLYGLAFGVAFLGTGALTRLCERFVFASTGAELTYPLHGATALVRASCDAALGLAAPALIAQTLCTIFAGAAARAAPRINGLMLSAPLVTIVLLLSLLAAAPAIFGRIVFLARAAGGVA